MGDTDMDKNCWEIIQCGDKESCPARYSGTKPCWEVMTEHNSFQCQYGLCDEFIVYLGKTGNPILSRAELKEVMKSRMGTRRAC